MFKKALKNEKGLTLIELLAVIVILAIVALIAVPSIMGIIQNSREDAVKSDAIQIINGAKMLHAQDTTNGDREYNWNELDDVVEISNAGEWAGTTVTVGTDGVARITAGPIAAGDEEITFTTASVQDINEHGANRTTTITGTTP